MSYIIVESSVLQELCSKCTEAMSNGYIPSGGLYVYEGRYYQSMYKVA